MAPLGATAKHVYDLTRSRIDILTMPSICTNDFDAKTLIVVYVFNCSILIIACFWLAGKILQFQ